MEEIFKKYRENILSNADLIKVLIDGKLPIIKGFEDINNIINLYNNAYDNDDWGMIFREEFSINNEYEIHQLLLNFIRPLRKIEIKTIVEMEKYKRNYKYFEKKYNGIIEKLNKSILDDRKKNKEIVENNRMHDMSTGIFSPEEANGRAFFNAHINKYESKKTGNLYEQLDDTYVQFFSYFYIKLEYLSSVGIEIYPHMNKKRISWKDKLLALNKLPLGNEINEENYQEIMNTANHFKHQTGVKNYPKMDFLNDFINGLFYKISMNLNFKEFWNSLESLYSKIEDILNPLGLTGFE